VTYDTKSVLERYAQLDSLPEGEPEGSDCPVLNGKPAIAGQPTCPLDGCRSCCVGAVEVVRRVYTHQVQLDSQELTLEDTLTRARDIERRDRER
jgi:hypothetical protein